MQILTSQTFADAGELAQTDRPRRTMTGRLGHHLAAAASALASECRIRRDLRELMAMDDRMLADIGLGRSDIGAAVRGHIDRFDSLAAADTHADRF